jgi:peptidyl-prolyl cis-trans isomerase C
VIPRKPANKKALFGFLLLALLAGCSRTSREDVIATVGNETLTRAMVAERGGAPFDSLSLTAKQQIAQGWIEETLLLLEAQRRGLDRDPAISRKVRELRSELLRSRLLKQLQSTETVSDSAISAYYEKHRGEFVRTQEEYEVELYWAPDRVTAELFRRATRGDMDLAEMAHPDVSLEGTWHVAASDLTSDEATELAQLNPGEFTTPRPAEDGYRLMRLQNRYAAGEAIPLDDVREEIRERLMLESSRTAMEALLAEASRRYSTTIHLGDSLQ